MTRNGKIARLPRPLRDELNRRLAHNEDGNTLLDWLNAAPDVKDLLARDFAGEPISKQNLHEWRHDGFVEWQSRQDLFAAAADLTDENGEWDALAANDFTERLAAVLVVRYADALAGWNGGNDEAFRLKLRDLRHFNQDLAVLRRYNQSAARLKMEQMPFYREEQQRAEAAASARKQSVAGARAYDERLARRRRETAAALMSTSATSAPPASPTPSFPASVEATSPAHAADQPAADQSNARNCDAGKCMAVDATALAAGMIRADFLIKSADSLRQGLTVIEEKCIHPFNLADRRSVQEAYASGVATVNRVSKEAGLLHTELPDLAGVDRLNAAIEALQREYPRMKSNLFRGFTAGVAGGIQQLRNAACNLHADLKRKTAIGASHAPGSPDPATSL